MKKNNIVKVLLITFLVIVLLSCFIKPSTLVDGEIVVGEIKSIGFASIFGVLFTAIQNNLDILVLVVLIGMMYGVLNKTDAYQQLVCKISNLFGNKKKLLLIISSVFFTLMSSIFGLQIELLVFVPFISAIILYSGYDKKTALATTIGSILIGAIGATFSNYTLDSINAYFGLNYMSQMIMKIFVLLMSMFLFISHVIKKSILNDKVEYLDIPNYDEVIKTKRKVLPMVVYIFMLLLLIVFGTFKFGSVVGFEIFTNMKEALINIPVLGSILGNVSVFSTFGYIDIAYMLLICSLVIGFVYNVSFDEIIDGMYNGGKKIIVPAIVILIVSSISYITLDYSFYLTIVNKLVSYFDSFNIFISTVATMVMSIFVPNISAVANNILPLIHVSGANNINALSLIVQTVYGLVMLIAPTSAILMFGLSYYKVTYGEWFKYIFKLFIYILVILMAVFIIVVLS